jgi:hypothetical protein
MFHYQTWGPLAGREPIIVTLSLTIERFQDLEATSCVRETAILPGIWAHGATDAVMPVENEDTGHDEMQRRCRVEIFSFLASTFCHRQTPYPWDGSRLRFCGPAPHCRKGRPKMSIQTGLEDVIVVDLPQELEGHRELQTVMETVRQRGGCDVIVDFSRVDIVGSLTFSRLLELRWVLRRSGHKLVLQYGSPNEGHLLPSATDCSVLLRTRPPLWRACRWRTTRFAAESHTGSSDPSGHRESQPISLRESHFLSLRFFSRGGFLFSRRGVHDCLAHDVLHGTRSHAG